VAFVGDGGERKKGYKRYKNAGVLKKTPLVSSELVVFAVRAAISREEKDAARRSPKRRERAERGGRAM
jgi:hypothetical protein